MVNVVESKAAFDAQTPFICRTINTFDEFDLVVFDLEGHLTANAAEWADAFHFTIKVSCVAHLVFVRDCSGQ
uniref:Uncharacterized protein n=1 Tax=uncultured marine bacterium Ant24C4 TaxID=360425 RepID=Q2PYD7_9BACT|nr:hypothetical protein [uncultured marine bacterium Ant24C4]